MLLPVKLSKVLHRQQSDRFFTKEWSLLSGYAACLETVGEKGEKRTAAQMTKWTPTTSASKDGAAVTAGHTASRTPINGPSLLGVELQFKENGFLFDKWRIF